MARTEQAPPERKRRRRVFPRLPRVSRSELRAGEEFRKLRDGINSTRHACPNDGSAMNLLDVFPTGPDGEIPEGAKATRALVCPDCAFTVPVSAIQEQLSQEAEPLKRAERQFTLFGFGILVAFGLIALVNGNVLTMIGALLLSLTLFLKALFYRYRHWQAVTGQMFQDTPPVGLWLRSELSRSAKTP